MCSTERKFSCAACLLREDGDDPQARAASVLRHLRPLAPRLYSISSSPLEDPCGCQITVAVVKYRDGGGAGKLRRGVASTYISERIAVGDCCAAFIERNRDFRLPPPPPAGADRPGPPLPLLMIGPGTGLAPFRAFVMHQRLQQLHQPQLLTS